MSIAVVSSDYFVFNNFSKAEQTVASTKGIDSEKGHYGEGVPIITNIPLDKKKPLVVEKSII